MPVQLFKYLKRFLFFTLTFLLIQSPVFAQKIEIEMATGLRSDGKIYVVVAVLCVIFTGVIFYLISLDKKITKLEKELKK